MTDFATDHAFLDITIFVILAIFKHDIHLTSKKCSLLLTYLVYYFPLIATWHGKIENWQQSLCQIWQLLAMNEKTC